MQQYEFNTNVGSPDKATRAIFFDKRKRKANFPLDNIPRISMHKIYTIYRAHRITNTCSDMVLLKHFPATNADTKRPFCSSFRIFIRKWSVAEGRCGLPLQSPPLFSLESTVCIVATLYCMQFVPRGTNKGHPLYGGGLFWRGYTRGGVMHTGGG